MMTLLQLFCFETLFLYQLEMILVTFLQLVLWYVSFVLPISAGFRLCRKTEPAPSDVSNIVNTFALHWTFELLDQLVFSSLIATRELFVIARIVFALYLVHPKFQGGVAIHKSVIEDVVGQYGNHVDTVLTEHLHDFRKNGAVEYLGKAGMQGISVFSNALNVGRALLAPSIHSSTPEASPSRNDEKTD